MFSIQQQAIRGTPDLLISCNGRFVACEIKATDTAAVSSLQLYHVDLIKKHGGLAFIVHPKNYKSFIATLWEQSGCDPE